jgi:hypothetical protein
MLINAYLNPSNNVVKFICLLDSYCRRWNWLQPLSPF